LRGSGQALAGLGRAAGLAEWRTIAQSKSTIRTAGGNAAATIDSTDRAYSRRRESRIGWRALPWRWPDPWAFFRRRRIGGAEDRAKNRMKIDQGERMSCSMRLRMVV